MKRAILLLIAVLLCYMQANASSELRRGGAQENCASSLRNASMQSQMMFQSGSTYSSSVYTPFDNTTPSAYSPASGASAPRPPSGPRKAGNFDHPGEYGGSEEYPLGEPWILLLMAAAMLIITAVKKRRTNKS